MSCCRIKITAFSSLKRCFHEDTMLMHNTKVFGSCVCVWKNMKGRQINIKTSLFQNLNAATFDDELNRNTPCAHPTNSRRGREKETIRVPRFPKIFYKLRTSHVRYQQLSQHETQPQQKEFPFRFYLIR